MKDEKMDMKKGEMEMDKKDVDSNLSTLLPGLLTYSMLLTPKAWLLYLDRDMIGLTLETTRSPSSGSQGLLNPVRSLLHLHNGVYGAGCDSESAQQREIDCILDIQRRCRQHDAPLPFHWLILSHVSYCP